MPYNLNDKRAEPNECELRENSGEPEHLEKGDGGRFYPLVEDMEEVKPRGESNNNPTNEDWGSNPSPVPVSSSSDDNAAMEKWLAANPALTVRDWKGKGFTEFAPFDPHYVAPGEKPFQDLTKRELAKMRWHATSTKARFLPKNLRQAAARDPLLEWDEVQREYRWKGEPPPRPKSLLFPFSRTGGGSGFSTPNPKATRTGGAGQ